MLGQRATVCVTGLVIFWSAAAQANVGMLAKEAGLHGPMTEKEVPLEVRKETLLIDCKAASAGVVPRCSFEARYEITNPTDAAVEVSAAFYGLRTRDITATLDGKSVTTTLAQATLDAIDARVQEVYAEQYVLHPSVTNPTSQRQAMAWTMDAGQSAVLVCSGEIDAGDYKIGSYAVSPHYSRHPFLAEQPHNTTYQLNYLLAPIRTWVNTGPIEITLRAPASWDLSGWLVLGPNEDDPEATLPPAPRWDSKVDGDQRLITATIDPHDGDQLRVQVDIDEQIGSLGGPLVGIGGAFGREGGLRLRAGWEAAAPLWLLWSVSAETDFDQWLVITPAAEAASPMILIIPSFGIGAGVPIRLRPDLAVGARLQSSMALGPVTFFMALDYYPTETEQHDPFQFTMMGQFSF